LLRSIHANIIDYLYNVRVITFGFATNRVSLPFFSNSISYRA